MRLAGRLSAMETRGHRPTPCNKPQTSAGDELNGAIACLSTHIISYDDDERRMQIGYSLVSVDSFSCHSVTVTSTRIHMAPLHNHTTSVAASTRRI